MTHSSSVRGVPCACAQAKMSLSVPPSRVRAASARYSIPRNRQHRPSFNFGCRRQGCSGSRAEVCRSRVVESCRACGQNRRDDRPCRTGCGDREHTACKSTLIRVSLGAIANQFPGVSRSMPSRRPDPRTMVHKGEKDPKDTQDRIEAEQRHSLSVFGAHGGDLFCMRYQLHVAPRLGSSNFPVSQIDELTPAAWSTRN